MSTRVARRSTMQTFTHNPIFKPPVDWHIHVSRPRTPPNAFVEPLSPVKPEPVEPSFNYPPLSTHFDYAVNPDQVCNATPRARERKPDHNGAHVRRPSTIDALAEAALAISPSYDNVVSRYNDVPGRIGTGYRSQQSHNDHGDIEPPPHKRTRSEMLPSPTIEQYASRPATSYEAHAWANPSLAGRTYNSRVEEAALLLNFQSGGWPGTVVGAQGQPSGPFRPHANSFPQDAFHSRPTEIAAPALLLPPFDAIESGPYQNNLPSPQRTSHDAQQSPRDPKTTHDVEMLDASSGSMFPAMPEPKMSQPQQTQTPPEETLSRTASADVPPRETSEGLKSRRGWPKGKPRGPGGRKVLSEKAISKKIGQRKKAAGETKVIANETVAAERRGRFGRRKSLNDVRVFGEAPSDKMSLQLSQRAPSVPADIPMLIRNASKATRRKASSKPETICAGCQVARQATTSHGELDEWISCNGCKKWFHVDCAGFKKAHEVRDIDKYFCAPCEPEHGKTTFVRKSGRAHTSVDYAELQRGVLKTSEESVEHHYIQPIKDGTFQFDPETFPRLRPEMATKDFFERSGLFTEPICIPAAWNPRPWIKPSKASANYNSAAPLECDGDGLADLLVDDFEYSTDIDNGQDSLGMVMPQGLTIRQVCQLVGPDTPIDVIDVKTQNSGAKWTLSKWADYYEEAETEKAIRNVISLEVSQTKLGRLLQRPRVVRDIDLQDNVWPKEEADRGKFPKVQFYCLMSVADSYTDFHIDFGGSSVYYHILHGKKTFFFIPPKPKHLKAYEEWNDSPQQNFTFLPHITKECYRVDLSEGDTMLIPSGWIHAVWTPEDSLVIGGNFLNRMAYKNQFRVVDIEKANETPMKFRYPHFQKVMWYTAIKYVQDDPLPAEVRQLFYEGHRFEREVPLWADFDGDFAKDDDRAGAQNAKYYGQAELEGLPDVVNFIFRTVMLVMGRVEGVSADRMRRVNASIPKGYGEPLELAKTFALWVAWKRGNEDPPAWAHPDAVLPNSKDNGPLKKLSERKLKELERREAIAAYRVVPDRQSLRVLSKTAAAKDIATSNEQPSLEPAPHQDHQTTDLLHQMQPHQYPSTPSAVSAPAVMLSSLPGQHLSTPKTSVLGPKRVACDACRKRRIRCKHKDLVIQADQTEIGPNDTSNAIYQSQLAPELYGYMNGISPTHTEPSDFFGVVIDSPKGQNYANGTPSRERHAPSPGTNAYVNANIPMTMNGVAMFGESSKRGRSKACYECRKSKRRCIHDEQGNVDPVKAAETPVPRGSVFSKKRQSIDDSCSVQPKGHQGQRDDELPQNHQPHQNGQMPGRGVFRPQVNPENGAHVTSTANGTNGKPDSDQRHESEPHSAQIDPNLFSVYPAPNKEDASGQRHPYPNSNSEPTCKQMQASYIVPSLEEIANEVLVDLSGDGPIRDSEQQRTNADDFGNVFDTEEEPLPNALSKPDEGVDSAVSLPQVNGIHHQQDGQDETGNCSELVNTLKREPSPASAVTHHELPPPHPSIEFRTESTDGAPLPPELRSQSRSARLSHGANALPLWKPPAPLSQSPEAMKRQPALPNGLSHGSGVSSTSHEVTPLKHKRDSMSVTPGMKSAKKAKLDDGAEPRELAIELTQEERQSLELAKMLQQEDLGLRRRSK